MHLICGQKYGVLQQDFSIDFPDKGYFTLTGVNNSGKSTILQFLFRELSSGQLSGFNVSTTCILFTERIYIVPDTQPRDRSLEDHNNELRGAINQNVMSYESSSNVQRHLPGLLLNHTDFIKQVTKMNELLGRMELPQYKIINNQTVTFNDIHLHFQGSGLRSLFYLFAALSDERIVGLLIDEPELGLEPRLARLLRDILQEESQNKLIIVATHSHLMLNRQDYKNNIKVMVADDGVETTAVTNDNEMYDITMSLLGNSVMDLFFPGNYLIVEGASDQIIAEKIQSLMGIDRVKVKTLSSSGVDNVGNTYFAVTNTLVPLLVKESPYAKRVVVLVDKSDIESTHYKELKKHLGNRLFTLDNPSLEEYIPSQLYELAGMNRDEELVKLSRLSSHSEIGTLKKKISNSIATVLTKDNYGALKLFVDAVNMANELAD